jgi:hypothetical protein
MKRRMLILLFLIVNLVLVAQVNFDCQQLKQQLKDTRNLIDSLRMTGSDNKIDSLNELLIYYLDSLTIQNRFQICDVNVRYDFNYLVSANKKLGIASWDTGLGGTMIDYTTTIIYKTKDSTLLKTIKYGKKGEEEANSLTMFDTLFTISDKEGQAIYLAYGYGQGSTLLRFRVLKAFMVKDKLIEEFKLFPDDSSELWLFYDLEHFNEKDEVLDMIFEEDGKQIKVPVIAENSTPTGNYYTLLFDGVSYKRK